MALGWFIGGALFGSLGIKALASKEAKKVYTKALSYGLDAKDCIMETADTLKENLDDVYADAKEMKAARDAEVKAEAEDADIIEDESEKEPVKVIRKTSAKKTTKKQNKEE